MDSGLRRNDPARFCFAHSKEETMTMDRRWELGLFGLMAVMLIIAVSARAAPVLTAGQHSVTSKA
jgi:hypothetical protein